MNGAETERVAALEAKLRALTARQNALAEGNFEIVGEGFRIGSTRLLEKLWSATGHSDEYHLYQRDSEGTESDLTGARSFQGIPVSSTAPTTTQILGYNATTNQWEPTAAGAAAAHKDAHDPQDGADALDTANAAAITVVVGAGTGSSHSFARADHIHAISHSILDNRLATIDGTTNAPVNLDYAKWTTLGLEGRTYAQLKSDIGLDAAAVAAVATADPYLKNNASDTTTGDLTAANFITAGNVDGRDVSADGTKLDGIEAAADVTDATNVNAAGAVMEGDTAGGDLAGTYPNPTVDAASKTAAGKVELATTAEIDTGTDSTRAMPVDQFVASDRNIRFVTFRLIEAATDCAVDTTVGGDWVCPFTGTLLQSDSDKNWCSANNDTAGVTGTMVVDVHKGGTTVMTTNKLDIETGEKSTNTATTQPDLTVTAVTAGDVFTFDIDAIHTGTAAKGLSVTLAIRMT